MNTDTQDPIFQEVTEEFGITWPLPEFSHQQFMAERNQSGWLSWQTTRPLTKLTKK